MLLALAHAKRATRTKREKQTKRETQTGSARTADLPTEILHQIGLLSGAEALLRLAQTSQRMRAVFAKESPVWRRAFAKQGFSRIPQHLETLVSHWDCVRIMCKLNCVFCGCRSRRVVWAALEVVCAKCSAGKKNRDEDGHLFVSHPATKHPEFADWARRLDSQVNHNAIQRDKERLTVYKSRRDAVFRAFNPSPLAAIEGPAVPDHDQNDQEGGAADDNVPASEFVPEGSQIPFIPSVPNSILEACPSYKRVTSVATEFTPRSFRNAIAALTPEVTLIRREQTALRRFEEVNLEAASESVESSAWYFNTHERKLIANGVQAIKYVSFVANIQEQFVEFSLAASQDIAWNEPFDDFNASSGAVAFVEALRAPSRLYKNAKAAILERYPHMHAVFSNPDLSNFVWKPRLQDACIEPLALPPLSNQAETLQRLVLAASVAILDVLSKFVTQQRLNESFPGCRAYWTKLYHKGRFSPELHLFVPETGV